MSIKKVSVHGQPRYQVRYRDPTGRQRKRNFSTKRQAEAFEDSELTSVRQGCWINPQDSATRFSDWATTWLQSNPAKRESSFARDESIIRVHLSPIFGQMAIGRVTPLDVQRSVTTWSQQYKPRTVQRHYRTLATILRSAVDCDLIVKSPCRGIKLPKIRKAEVADVEPDKLPELADALGTTGLMAYFGATLGLRWGEVAAIRVGHLDLLGRTVRIVESVGRDRHGNSILSPPKTESSVRTLAMPSGLVAIVAKYLAELGVNASNGDQLLFTNRDGGLLSYSHWRSRQWLPAREKIGMPSLKFHDLRRWNATLMVANGVDIRTAQHRLGHSDPRMTLAVYAQVSPQADANAAVCLEQAFGLG